jgi:hypothetical protein
MYYKRNGLKVLASDLALYPTSQMSGRRRIYRLVKHFRIHITMDGVKNVISVPAGFATDMATIPLVAQLLIGSRDDPGVAEAAVAHDWLCTQDAPREYANATMWVIMLALGVPRWRATAIYLALMLFGYKSLPSRLWRMIRGFQPLES